MFAPDVRGSDMGGYPEPGSIQDVREHPDMNLPDPGYQPAMQHSTQMAGDVLPIPGEKSLGSGPDKQAGSYYEGTKSSPKVQSILGKQLSKSAFK